MVKRRSYPTHPPADRRVVVRVSAREAERKIRKPLPPSSKIHASKKTYRRKPKHPKRDDE